MQTASSLFRLRLPMFFVMLLVSVGLSLATGQAAADTGIQLTPTFPVQWQLQSPTLKTTNVYQRQFIPNPNLELGTLRSPFTSISAQDIMLASGVPFAVISLIAIVLNSVFMHLKKGQLGLGIFGALSGVLGVLISSVGFSAAEFLVSSIICGIALISLILGAINVFQGIFKPKIPKTPQSQNRNIAQSLQSSAGMIHWGVPVIRF